LAFDYQEIYSYSKLTKTKINKIEALIIKRLSVEYVNTYYQAKDEDFEAPYLDKI
jgi:hypothetical protein